MPASFSSRHLESDSRTFGNPFRFNQLTTCSSSGIRAVARSIGPSRHIHGRFEAREERMPAERDPRIAAVAVLSVVTIGGYC